MIQVSFAIDLKKCFGVATVYRKLLLISAVWLFFRTFWLWQIAVLFLSKKKCVHVWKSFSSERHKKSLKFKAASEQQISFTSSKYWWLRKDVIGVRTDILTESRRNADMQARTNTFQNFKQDEIKRSDFDFNRQEAVNLSSSPFIHKKRSAI